VIHAGVTFEVSDIEALVSLIYAQRFEGRFVGVRSQRASPHLDFLGRPTDSPDRDINPGAFHVILANMVGHLAKGFVIDRSNNREVRNVPVRSYRVINAADGQLLEVSSAQAAHLLRLDLAFAVLLGTTTLARNEVRSGAFTVPRTGEYLFALSGTGDADLVVQVMGNGGLSAQVHVSDRANSFDQVAVQATSGETINWTVTGYAPSSTVELRIGSQLATAGYTPNLSAARFFHVELELKSVEVAFPSRTSRMISIDDFTRTDMFSYVLEADAGGKMLGGEWIGESAVHHPDFLWWPTSRPTSERFAGLSYADVRLLLDASNPGN
jgi:hypothetical protein